MGASEGDEETDDPWGLSGYGQELAETTVVSAVVLALCSGIAYVVFGLPGLAALGIVTVGSLVWLLAGLSYIQSQHLEANGERLETDLSSIPLQQGPAIVDDNEVFVELGNGGRGEIQAIHLEVTVHGEFDEFDLGPGRTALTPVESDKESVPLRPFGPYREFSATAKVGVRDGPDGYRQYPFDDVAVRLRRAGYRRFEVSVRVLAEDPTGVRELDVGREEVLVGDAATLADCLPGTYGGLTRRSVDESFSSIAEAF